MDKDIGNNSSHGCPIAAFLLAPLPALLIVTMFIFIGTFAAPDNDMSSTDFLPSLIFFTVYVVIFGLLIVYAIELVLGVPTFIILKKLGVENIWVTILLASLFAGGVFLVFAFLLLDTSPTTQDFIGMAKATLVCMALGAISGLTFWKIYRRQGIEPTGNA